MFTTHASRTVVVHPAKLLVLATILGLLTATLLGADSTGIELAPPGLLSANTHDGARPIDEDTVVDQLWQAIEDHEAGRTRDAIAVWHRVAAPYENEVWRHLGLGVAYLYEGRLNEAADELAQAQAYDAENAPVHYFAGLLHMEQAEAAGEYSDALHFNGTQRVSHTEVRQQAYDGKPKSRHELEAIRELELAIRFAPGLDLAAPLVPVYWVVAAPYPATTAPVPPTVGELLVALGADNFAGKSHGLLAQMYVERGNPDQAEQHVDEAGLRGISVPYGYRLVGKLYEEQGRSTDAFRAFAKALKGGNGVAQPSVKALQNLRNAFEDLF